jgi:hypothetical protein
VSRAPDFSSGKQAARLSWDRALLFFALAVGALSGWSAWAAAGDRESAQSEAQQERREVSSLQATLGPLTQASGALVLTRQAELTRRAAPAAVLAHLAGLLPAAVRIESVDLRYGNVLELKIQVRARSPRDYDELLERIRSSPNLRDLSLGPERREGEVRASVQALYDPAR